MLAGAAARCICRRMMDSFLHNSCAHRVYIHRFANHQKPLAMLRQKSQSLLGKVLGLVKAGATRFGTNTLVGCRLLELKGPLQTTVVDPEYTSQNYGDEPDTQQTSNAETKTRTNKLGCNGKDACPQRLRERLLVRC